MTLARVPESQWGGALRKYRENLGLTRDEFAERLNIVAHDGGQPGSCSSRQVARWENGETPIPGAFYLRLLRQLGAPDPSAIVDPNSEYFIVDIAAAAVGSPEGLWKWFAAEGGEAAATPGRVELTDIDAIHTAIRSFRDMEQQAGGTVALPGAHS